MPISRNPRIEGSQTQHYVSLRKRRGRKKSKLQPPLTPMIDVTFLLLLYFLVTSTFRPDEGRIPGTLPARAGVAPRHTNPIKPIRIVIRPRGGERQWAQYEVDHLPPVDEPEALFVLLRRRRQTLGSTDVPVVIEPWSTVRWKYVVQARNAARRAKLENIHYAPAG